MWRYSMSTSIRPIDSATNSLGPILDPLSERELEVLQWLASGVSNREISRRLYITESTVKRHVYNIFGKLNVRNRTQAALQARAFGLTPQLNLSME
ncbi:MAG: helix-turn-helix transcriptional regulator [Anaerolineaceae bacterium]|nr:helix-turn-helix transcriptional regulator [Anaerolineaceae bacterium]MCB9099468.1 helix-turn-helix transcriptional regulator [Anaerolineales bacterium]